MKSKSDLLLESLRQHGNKWKWGLQQTSQFGDEFNESAAEKRNKRTTDEFWNVPANVKRLHV